MSENLNKDQMIHETYFATKAIEKRMDRHSAEYTRGFEKIWEELKEIRKIASDEKQEAAQVREKQNERIKQLETEKNIFLKIMVPLIAAISGGLVSWFTGLFNRHQ